MVGGVVVAMEKYFLELCHVNTDLINININVPLAQFLQKSLFCRRIFHRRKFSAQFDLEVIRIFEAAACFDIWHVHVFNGILWLVLSHEVSAGKGGVILFDFVSQAVNALQRSVAFLLPRR
jgi:hypothetical protein